MERERITAEGCSWIEEINTMQGVGEEKVSTGLANAEPFILQYQPTRQDVATGAIVACLLNSHTLDRI